MKTIRQEAIDCCEDWLLMERGTLPALIQNPTRRAARVFVALVGYAFGLRTEAIAQISGHAPTDGGDWEVSDLVRIRGRIPGKEVRMAFRAAVGTVKMITTDPEYEETAPMVSGHALTSLVSTTFYLTCTQGLGVSG